MVTALSTDASVSNPSMNSPMMRITRHGSVRVKSTRGPGCWSSFSCSVTGDARIESSTTLAPAARFGETCDGFFLTAFTSPAFYTLSLHDALPISLHQLACGEQRAHLLRGKRLAM